AGTIGYAAPEQLGARPGEKASPASDIFGFAKTCCFALFQTPEPLPKQWGQLPHHLSELLEQCLAPAPKDRPGSFTEVLERMTPRAKPEKEAKKAPKKPVVELRGDEAAALDDLCALDALAKLMEKYQKDKKDLAERHGRARALQLWFDGKARPDNPSL